MAITESVKLSPELKTWLDKKKVERESYDHTIKRLLGVKENEFKSRGTTKTK